MKSKVTIKKVEAPIFGSDLYIVVANDVPRGVEVLCRKIKHYIKPAKYKHALALADGFEDKDGYFVVSLFVTPESTPGMIAHEAKHGLNYLCGWYGQKLDADNDEFECYYLQWLVDKIHDTVREAA